MARALFDQTTSIAKCLWTRRPELRRNEVKQEDVILLLRLTGKRIGNSLDGRREFYVQDGIVYMVWPGVDVSCLDYFEFCKLLRGEPPTGRVLDFEPAEGFHLGWPKAQGECSPQPVMTTILPPRPMTFGPDQPQAMRLQKIEDMLASGRGRESAPIDNPTTWTHGYADQPYVPSAEPMGPPPIVHPKVSSPEMPKQTGGPAEFELLYDPEGHGGAFFGLGPATMNAFLHLTGGSDSCVHIVPRSNRVLNKADAIRRVFKDADGLVYYQDDPSQKPAQVTPNLFT